MTEPEERDEGGWLTQAWLDRQEERVADFSESEERWVKVFRVQDYIDRIADVKGSLG